MYQYIPVFEEKYSEQKEIVLTCGIRVLKREGDACIELDYISDVFTDLKLGEQFAELCTREQVDPIHLQDVIEDHLL